MSGQGTGVVAVVPAAFDADDVQVVLEELAVELGARYGDEDPGYRAELDAAQVTPPAGVFLAVRRDGELVGCGAVRPWVAHVPGAPAEPAVGEIKRMYVRPAHRGVGLSRTLLAALEDEARRLGYRILRLETGLAQPEALRLYETSGYHRIPPYGRYAHSPRSVCLEKPLG